MQVEDNAVMRDAALDEGKVESVSELEGETEMDLWRRIKNLEIGACRNEYTRRRKQELEQCLNFMIIMTVNSSNYKKKQSIKHVIMKNTTLMKIIVMLPPLYLLGHFHPASQQATAHAAEQPRVPSMTTTTMALLSPPQPGGTPCSQHSPVRPSRTNTTRPAHPAPRTRFA